MANPLNLSPAFRRFVEQLLCCWSPETLSVTDLTVTDDLSVAGAFTRQTVAQPIIRQGTGTLVGGTLVIPATWITANTDIQITYTGGAAVADSPSYTITASTSFAVFGTGTNSFSWVAFTPQA